MPQAIPAAHLKDLPGRPWIIAALRVVAAAWIMFRGSGAGT
jgi:hypothetical protein